MNYNVIAVDGTSCSGKETICKIIAEKTEYKHLDTGLFYRALAYYAIQNDLNENNINDLVELADSLEFTYKNNKLLVNGEDLGERLRTNEVNELVSKTGSIKDVRLVINSQIRKVASTNKFIIDGRDIGSLVFKDAFLKIYMDADIEVRAKRRMEQNIKKGIEADYNKILENLQFRDKIDKCRDFAALIKCDDAISIDTTNISIDEAVEIILKNLEEKL